MLTPVMSHPWDLSPREAIALQRDLAARVERRDRLDTVHLVAGIDVSVRGDRSRAAVVVMRLPELDVVEEVLAERPVTFPYVPGLLSFREAPVILDALARLESTPQVLLCDGQGIAHPRRLGIASHLGVVLNHPTIGCAKSRLTGTYSDPAPERGSYTWLYAHDDVIGAVLRTRSRVKPVFVSIGHRVTLETAIDLVLRCGAGYRLPEPTRRADRAAAIPSP
jgi:deoxyribonuclease V